MSVPYMISGAGNISVFVKGEQHYITPDATNYNTVLEAIKNNESEDEIEKIVKPEVVLNKYLHNRRIKIKDGIVYYKGREVHNTLTDKVIAFVSARAPFEPLLMFLDKLMRNPSEASRQELFDFLGHQNLPICDDGDFLAYKAVRSDYMDKWEGKFDNTPGNEVKMKRSEVDPDRSKGCSKGLHAGTIEYVKDYGAANDKFVIVKINPEDVVSVPTDCNFQKLRTRKYFVVTDYKEDLPGTYISVEDI